MTNSRHLAVFIAVGRYRFPKEVKKHVHNFSIPDLEWCRNRKMDYLPVAFPGFSWHNLKCTDTSPFNQIPRLKGDFFWSQIASFHSIGCSMLYIAMFDEVDEGTAIFKCQDNVPSGCFCNNEGLPSDHYLRLAGKAARLFRKASSISSSRERTTLQETCSFSQE